MAPKRGVRSLYALTPSVRGNVIAAALNADTLVVPLPSAGLKLQARSYRSAACSVRRDLVQVSWTNTDAVSVRSDAVQFGRRNVNWFATWFWNRYASSESFVTIN